jgi:hypothetical protein
MVYVGSFPLRTSPKASIKVNIMKKISSICSFCGFATFVSIKGLGKVPMVVPFGAVRRNLFLMAPKPRVGETAAHPGGILLYWFVLLRNGFLRRKFWDSGETRST